MPRTIHQITHEIIGSAIEVHRVLGPGLLESAYQRCLEREMLHRGLLFECQRSVGLTYRGVSISDVYRLDFVVEGQVIVEVKSVARWEPVFDSQVLTYLRLTGLRVGLLINFNVPALLQGVKRVVLNFPEPSSAPSAPLR